MYEEELWLTVTRKTPEKPRENPARTQRKNATGKRTTFDGGPE